MNVCAEYFAIKLMLTSLRPLFVQVFDPEFEEYVLLESIDQLVDKAKLRLAQSTGTAANDTKISLQNDEGEGKALDLDKVEADAVAESCPVETSPLDLDKVEADAETAKFTNGKEATMRSGPMGLDIVGNEIRKVLFGLCFFGFALVCLSFRPHVFCSHLSRAGGRWFSERDAGCEGRRCDRGREWAAVVG